MVAKTPPDQGTGGTVRTVRAVRLPDGRLRVESNRPRLRGLPSPEDWPKYQLTLPGAKVERNESTQKADPDRMGRVWAVETWPDPWPVWKPDIYQATRGEGPAWMFDTEWMTSAMALNPRPRLAFVDARGSRAREALQKNAENHREDED